MKMNVGSFAIFHVLFAVCFLLYAPSSYLRRSVLNFLELFVLDLSYATGCVSREHWLFYYLCVLQTSPSNIATASSSSSNPQPSSLSLSLSLSASLGCQYVFTQVWITDIQCHYPNQIYSRNTVEGNVL